MGQVSYEEVPPPPPPGSHNSELFPELDSQVVDKDLRDAVNAVMEASAEDRARARESEGEVDYGGQEEDQADTQEEDDDKKEEEESEADDFYSAAESMELDHEFGPDPQLEHLSTVDDFGLDRKLADFIHMPPDNLQPLVDIIKAFDPDPENHPLR